MMTETLLKTLRSEINQAKQSADNTPGTIHNTQTLWLAVSTREFFNELNFLDKLLTYPLEQIPTEFKARCALRQTNADAFISFADHPATLTNRLYYKLANIIFNPGDLYTLLQILMPNTTRCFQWVSARVQVSEMTLLTGVPFTEHALDDCVFFEDGVFPLQINLTETRSLQAHLELYLALKTTYPVLFRKLYHHNNDYKTLVIHLQEANDIAPSFRERLLSLISSLREGGSKKTGLDHANASATLAIGQFSEYFHSLPLAVQKTLKSLPSGNSVLRTFEDLFDVMGNKDTSFDTCIETGANNLEVALKLNNGSELFDFRPVMEQETLDHLTAHYEKLSLNRTRETDTLIVLPLIVLKSAFEQLTPDSPEAFLLILRDLPPETYSALLEHMHLPDASHKTQQLFDTLSEYCREGLLNEEQRVALLDALLEIDQKKFHNVSMSALTQLLFNQLPLNVNILRLMNNPSRGKFDTFLSLIDRQNCFLTPSAQEATILALPPVIGLELSFAYRHFSNGFALGFISFLRKTTNTTLESLVFECFPDLGASSSLISRILSIADIKRRFDLLKELFVALSRMNISVFDFHDSAQRNLLYYMNNGMILTNADALGCFNFMGIMSQKAQIQFLDQKIPSGQRVIDMMLGSDAVRERIQLSAIRNVDETVIWLLRFLTDKNLNPTHIDELINTALSQPSWAAVRSTLEYVLSMQANKSRYFAFAVDDYPSLFAFYSQMGFELSKEVCYEAIVATAKLKPSLGNIAFIETALKHYFKEGRVHFSKPLTDESRTLLNCVLAQSCIPSPDGGVIFNPVLLLLFHSKMKRAHYHSHFSQITVTVGAPINRTLTIGELINEVLFYIPSELRTSPTLVRELYTTMVYHPKRDVTADLKETLKFAFNAPDNINACIEEALLTLNTQHRDLKFKQYVKLIKTYFTILDFAEKNCDNNPALNAYLETVCRKYSPIKRLILFNMRPHGAKGSLNMLFGELIKPIMASIHHRFHFSNLSVATLEEYLQFTDINWLTLLQKIVTYDNVHALRHLLATRLPQMQAFDQQHSLIALSLARVSADRLYCLHSFGFTLKNAAPLIPRRALNVHLSRIMTQTNHLSPNQFLRLIDAFIKAGADVNNTHCDNRPPLFHTYNLTVMERLLEHGANTNFVTASGETILTSMIEGITRGFNSSSPECNRIIFLLKHGLSPDILNHCVMIDKRPTTLLSALFERHLHGTDSWDSDLRLECIEALINAGANPLFWQTADFAFPRLIYLFPNNARLLSLTSQYETIATLKPTFELIPLAVLQAMTAYHQQLSSHITSTPTVKQKFLDHDAQNKLSYLKNISKLFHCAFSLDEIYAALETFINICIDSDVEGIITVKRQPDLPSHYVLFDLIRAVYGEARVPRLSPPIVEASGFKRYFVGKVPQKLLIGCDISVFLAELHPDQFCTFNVFECFRSDHASQINLSLLAEEQLLALFNQFFLDAKQHKAMPHHCISRQFTELKNNAMLAHFYTRLFHFTYTDEHSSLLLNTFDRLPPMHRPIFISAIPIESRFEILIEDDDELNPFIIAVINSVIGEATYNQLVKDKYRHQPIIAQPRDIGAESFIVWEDMIAKLYETFPIDSRGDTVFQYAARQSTSVLSNLFETIGIYSCIDRIILMLMKNASGESVLSLLKKKQNYAIVPDLLDLLFGGHKASATLSDPYIKKICLGYPEFFFPILYINIHWPKENNKVQCLHARHCGVVLVDTALWYLQESKQFDVLKRFPVAYQDYFKLKIELLNPYLLPQKPKKHSLFTRGYNTLADQNHERINTLNAFTDETLFEHLTRAKLDKAGKQRQLRQ